MQNRANLKAKNISESQINGRALIWTVPATGKMNETVWYRIEKAVHFWVAPNRLMFWIKAGCKSFGMKSIFYSHANKNSFSQGFAVSLSLKREFLDLGNGLPWYAVYKPWACTSLWGVSWGLINGEVMTYPSLSQHFALSEKKVIMLA